MRQTEIHGEIERERETKRKRKRGTNRHRGRKRDTEKKAETQTKRFGNRHTYIKVIETGIQRCTERNTCGERERENHPTYTDPENTSYTERGETHRGSDRETETERNRQ